jgi:hypothetical protein
MADQAMAAGWGGAAKAEHGNGERVAFNGAMVALMLADGEPTVAGICERLGVTRSTAYRYLRAAKAALQEVRGA